MNESKCSPGGRAPTLKVIGTPIGWPLFSMPRPEKDIDTAVPSRSARSPGGATQRRRPTCQTKFTVAVLGPSLAVAVTVILPDTVAPASGDVIVTAGAVVSTWTSCVFVVSVLPALSQARNLTVVVVERAKGAL